MNGRRRQREGVGDLFARQAFQLERNEDGALVHRHAVERLPEQRTALLQMRLVHDASRGLRFIDADQLVTMVSTSPPIAGDS
jgi:hypothetical protein